MIHVFKYISNTLSIVGIWRDEHILQIVPVQGRTVIILPTVHNLETFPIATSIFHQRTLSFHNSFRPRYDPVSKFGKVWLSCKTSNWPEELFFLWTMAPAEVSPWWKPSGYSYLTPNPLFSVHYLYLPEFFFTNLLRP